MKQNKNIGVLESLGLTMGHSVELLKALHILTREGGVNQDSRRKLKQVQHLVQFIRPLLEGCEARASEADEAWCVVDHGAGKSYLGFMLYDWCLRDLPRSRVVGVESRAELVASSRALAQSLGFDRMAFRSQTVSESTYASDWEGPVRLVTALHACDTATDDAIEFALHHQAQAVVLVPCCQAELARTLNHSKALQLGRSSLAEIWRHPLHTREFGSQFTNVLRCLYLEAMGFQVTVTELVGWEHSMKNELILAKRIGRGRLQSARRMWDLGQQMGVEPWLSERFPRLSALEPPQSEKSAHTTTE